MVRLVFLLLLASNLVACRSSRLTGNRSLHLRFLSEYLLPDSTIFRGTRVGGLSGIDYDSMSKTYYLISDDRSDYSPARFYAATISINDGQIDSLQFIGVTFLLQKSGVIFPNKNQDPLLVADPEAIRLNQKTGELFWTNEGERIVNPMYRILQDPAIFVMKQNGTFLREFVLPENIRVTGTEKGPRRNGVFEGLAFSPDFQHLFVSLEEPLYEDGPRAGGGDSSAWVRILRFDIATGQALAQYAYQIDAVVKPPTTTSGFVVNGIVDVLALDEYRLLVTERSYSSGYVGCNVRLYEVDIREAEDIANVPSLGEMPPKKFLRKKLVLNLDSLGREVYNIEGATFGPRLSNGSRSLLLVADDNFSGREKTQLLLFELQEK